MCLLDCLIACLIDCLFACLLACLFTCLFTCLFACFLTLFSILFASCLTSNSLPQFIHVLLEYTAFTVMFRQCWFNIGPDVGPTLNQHWRNILCLLGYNPGDTTNIASHTFSHSVLWFALRNVYRYQPISHSSCRFSKMYVGYVMCDLIV